MIKGIYDSAAGMLPRYIKLAAIANNLANVNTPGYKLDEVHFGTVLDNELTQPDKGGKARSEMDRQMVHYVDFTQGSLENTGQKTHFAINGKGFFMVENPESGERFYTRNGDFLFNDQSELVDSQGFRVLLEDGAPIIAHGNNLLVSEDRQVFVDGEPIGKLAVMTFENLNDIVKRGNSLYSNLGNQVPEEPEDTVVLQGFLETSNVNLVQQMVDMITLNRNYESSQRALVAQDDTLKKAVQQVGAFS